MLETINKQKDEIIAKLRKNIRKKAMKNVEKNIAYNQKKISDFSKDELRKLVKKEEKEDLQKKDSSKKELTEFIESLDTNQFMKIRDFFEGMPRLKHIVEWKCPKCDKTADMLLEGIDSFFG